MKEFSTRGVRAFNYEKTYKVIHEYSQEEILGFCCYPEPKSGVQPLVFTVKDRNYTVKIAGRRLNTFRHSRFCVACGIEGKVVRLEHHRKGTTALHFNLYAIHEDGTYMQMTMDHILPKSRGGTDGANNLQTMCQLCNEKKGNRLERELSNGFFTQKHQKLDPRRGASKGRSEDERRILSIPTSYEIIYPSTDGELHTYLSSLCTRQQVICEVEGEDRLFQDTRWSTVGQILNTFADGGIA